VKQFLPKTSPKYSSKFSITFFLPLEFDLFCYFRLCSRVLKDYVQKQSELIAINNNKLSRKREKEGEAQSNEEGSSQDESGD